MTLRVLPYDIQSFLSHPRALISESELIVARVRESSLFSLPSAASPSVIIAGRIAVRTNLFLFKSLHFHLGSSHGRSHRLTTDPNSNRAQSHKVVRLVDVHADLVEPTRRPCAFGCAVTANDDDRARKHRSPRYCVFIARNFQRATGGRLSPYKPPLFTVRLLRANMSAFGRAEKRQELARLDPWHITTDVRTFA